MSSPPREPPPGAASQASRRLFLRMTSRVRDSVLIEKQQLLADTRPTLLVLSGPLMGRRFPLVDLPITIGRSDRCAVQLPDERVSGRHAVIAVDDSGRFVLRDLGSLNGTLINSEAVTERVLEEGDRILIGHTSMRFVMQTAAEEELMAELESRAMHDGLTGLFNRRFFDQRVADEVAYAKRHRLPLSMLLADIDRFKLVNDNYGHPAGDRVLAEVAAYLASVFRAEDVVARVGGEEFGIVLRKADHAYAMTTATRVASGLKLVPVQIDESRTLHVTISIGVATVGSTRATSPSRLFEVADQELYRAKTEGRDRVYGVEL